MDTSEIRTLVGNTIFTVDFIKRSNGEYRRMNCRLGVRKYLSGGDRTYDPDRYGLLPVFDLQKRAYRSIPVDAIHEVRARGLKISPTRR